MASVYKRTHRKPVPAGAEVATSVRAIPGGASVSDDIATWVDRSGCKRSAAVEGRRILIGEARWVDDRGLQKSAPVDHTGKMILLVDQFWMGSFTDAKRQRIRRSTKTADKATAQRITNKWESDARLRSEGVIDPLEESLSSHSSRSIAAHVEAFIAFRATGGGTVEHRDRTKGHIEEFVAAGNWGTIADISADDVTRHVESLRHANASARTIQGRLQSIKSFTKWLADQHRLRVNPLSMISKPNPRADRRHERRMLLPDEWPWLAKSLRDSASARNGMEPAERLLLDRLAIQTGLRASEIDELTRGRLALDGEYPFVLCKAAGTKNRKPAKQYVDQVLAGELREHISKKHPKAAVFGISSKDDLSRMIEADLQDARNAWLKPLPPAERIEQDSSDFLLKANHDGEQLVFHSLRHTCGAWLALAGEHPKVIQTVMRHGTITLTMDTYGHLFPGQTENAPRKLAEMMQKAIASADRGEAG